MIIVTRAGSHVREQWVESAVCLTCWESRVRGLTPSKGRTRLDSEWGDGQQNDAGGDGDDAGDVGDGNELFVR